MTATPAPIEPQAWGDLIAGLPGEEFARQGFADLAAGLETIPSLLIQIAHHRLTGADLALPPPLTLAEYPEDRLYRLLDSESQDYGHPYPRYNALIRRLVSFNRALDSRLAARPEPVA